ncbi:MAG: hypothetical protein WCB34_00030 [Methylovirgula sp.]
MNEQPIHRYKIWQLAGDGPAERRKPEPARQVEDLVALMALYDYRPLIEAELRGTCSLPNSGPTNCKTTTISSEAVNLVYDVEPSAPPTKRSDEIPAGSAVHLNLDQIGTFRGVVASKESEGFRVAVDDECRPMLRNKLTHMAAEHAVGLYEGSAVTKSNITRIEPTIKSCSFLDHTGTLRTGIVVNVSQIDALIKARIIPPLGSRITFRGSSRHLADVTRTFEMGFAVRFCNPIPAEEFSAAIKLSDE